MQLFTIGLYELNLDGSPNRDGNLNTYPVVAVTWPTTNKTS